MSRNIVTLPIMGVAVNNTYVSNLPTKRGHAAAAAVVLAARLTLLDYNRLRAPSLPYKESDINRKPHAVELRYWLSAIQV